MIEPLSLDSSRQVLAQQYALDRLKARAVSLAITILTLAILGPAGAAVGLRNWTDTSTHVWVLQILLFFGVLGIAASLVTTPLTYFRGFVLPHRYGQSNQNLREWLLDLFKAMLIGGVLGGITIVFLYILLRLDHTTWWVWAWLGYTFLSLVLATLAPLVIVPVFFKLQPLRDPSLGEEILRLAKKGGTHIRDVREINLSSKTPAANAAVIGLGTTRKIVLGDTLLEEFPREEVEVVVAHELGHHVHQDLGKGLVLDAALSLVGFAIAGVLLSAATTHWHFQGVWDLAAFPLIAVILGIWGSLTGVVTRAYSRRREAAADAYSLSLTGLGEAFRNSEIRLTNQNLGWFRPPIWMEFLFYTHPAPWRRVAMGDSYLGRGSARA
jgi:STE24 endopeptidase